MADAEEGKGHPPAPPAGASATGIVAVIGMFTLVCCGLAAATLGVANETMGLAQEIKDAQVVATGMGAPPAGDGMMHYLAASSDTIHWGYYSKTLSPQLTINSGETVTVEMITHHAGDYYDGMIKGDAGIEDIYKWGAVGSTLPGATPGTTTATDQRGASGHGEGVHVLTGPIFVTDAEPGDIIQVDILDLRPRVNPNTGKTFGINAAAWWGYSYGLNGPSATSSGMTYLTGPTGANGQREMTTVYEIVTDSAGHALYAQPSFSFQYGAGSSVTTPCLDGNTFGPGVSVPCVNGVQTWHGYEFPGLITQHPTGTENYTIAGAWQVPINFHIGSMGLAPPSPLYVDSIIPMPYGGNLDNRRIGIGATMYYRVGVAGGLLSMGDAHTAQGDSELDGTAIETSITGDFRISLIKKGPSMPAFLSGINAPLLENANEYVVHGFTYNNYLTELNYADTTSCITSTVLGGQLGANVGCPTENIYFKSNIDAAMLNAHKNARNFVMSMGYNEDAATTMITTAADFGITQIVDGNWGVHCSIPKYIFSGSETTAYTQATTCGGSIPAESMPKPLAAITTQHLLAANASTIHWGYYSNALTPAITINSGETITVEMITHHAGDYYEGMIKGDAGIEDIYKWGVAGVGSGLLGPSPGGVSPGTTFAAHKRGASGGGDGVHVLTGPIAVAGAQPGDILKVEVLGLRPRVNPNTGKTFGINAAAWWGYHFGVNGPHGRGAFPASFPTAAQVGYITGDPNREITTIYEVVNDAAGNPLYMQPTFQFLYGAPGTIMTPCVGTTLPSQQGNILTFNPGTTVACTLHTDGNYYQNWTGYQFPGLITNHPTGTEDYSVAGKWQIPINMHIGSMGLAPASPTAVDSIPPMVTGGNLDDRRIGVGATMYYRVAVSGGLLSMGDAHMAQGDSELDGTAIETSITGDFRITVIPQASTPAFLRNLNYPLLENENEFVVHGFTYTDYLTELGYADMTCGSPLGCPTDIIYFKSSTDTAVANAYHNAKGLLMNMGYSEDAAISMLSVACDFGMTQVVDGNWGAHVVIPKYLLSPQTAPYQRKTMCQSSTPAQYYREL